MKKILIVLVTYISGVAAIAQTDFSLQYPVTPISEQNVSSAGFMGPNTLTIGQSPDISNQNYNVKKADFFVKLSIDDLGLHKIGDALDNIEVKFDITKHLTSGSYTENITMNLTGFEAEMVYKYDFTDELADESIISFEIDVASVTSPVISGYPTLAADLVNYINTKLSYRSWYEIQYGLDVRKPSPGLAACESLSITPKNLSELTLRIQTFNWSSAFNYDVPSYEFELLKLENNASSDPTDFKSIVDWSKALKLETYNSITSLMLTISQGSGYYIWRVRPIGNFYDGGIADSRNWGQWSAGSLSNGDIVEMPNPTSYTYVPTCFKYLDVDEDKNWMYNRVFTEEGHVSEGMIYANNLLQPVQSQSYSSSTDSTITSQSFYDYLGRPALNALPIPTAGKLLGYKDNFSLNTLGELYSAKDFDEDSKINAPEKFEDATSAYSYFSGSNPDLFVPDAEQYPFSRTIFMNDGSGRPIEQSGVGRVHAIGEITNGTTHTTKLYYATPSDDELIAIFGDEAPLAENVLKTSSMDPNGTVNIVYNTIEGKTIATAMTHISASNLDDIDQVESAELNMDANHVTVVNTMDHNMFVSSKVLTLFETTNVRMTYAMDPVTIANTCGTPDCDYKIKFRIINELTGEYSESQDIDVTSGANLDFTGTVFTPALFTYVNDSDTCRLTLPEGYWKVQKVVWSNIDPTAISASGPMSKLEPLMRVVSDWMQEVTNDAEYDAFIALIESFNTDIAAAHAAAAGVHTPNFEDASSPYQLHPLFIALRLAHGLDTDYIFDPDYTFELPTNGAGEKYISFQAGCCNSVDVDIPGIEAHTVCDPIDEKLELGTLDEIDITYSQVFKYFFDELIEDEVFTLADLDAEWANVAPGYGDLVEAPIGEFHSSIDTMIYHMLTDQYYSGKAYNQSATPTPDWVTFDSKDDAVPVSVYPIPSGASADLYGPYYNCNDLYNCWYATMRAYYQMESLKGESFNVYDAVNEDDDGTGNPAGDHYDDEESADAEGGFLNWLINNIISIKMKKFSDEANGDTGGDNPNPNPQFAFQLNMPDLFLECTGKKIAAIVSPEIQDEVNYEIYDNDYEDSDYPDIDPILARDENGDKLIPDALMYPYILKPIWAFKYYEYIPGVSVSGTSLTEASFPPIDLPPNADLLNSLPPAEISSCYHKFTDDVVYCSSNPCEFDHHTWSAEERFSFYRNIEYTKQDETFDPAADPGAAPECPTPAELLAMRDAEINKAYAACNSRKDEFRAGIEYMLLENCYLLVPCNDGTGVGDNYVSEIELETLTNNTVAECSTYVDNIKIECEGIGTGSPFVPSCTLIECYYWNGAGFTLSSEATVELFDPLKTTKDKLYYVQYGNFIPALDPTDSKCITPPLLPDWYTNEAISPNCPEEPLTPIIVD